MDPEIYDLRSSYNLRKPYSKTVQAIPKNMHLTRMEFMIYFPFNIHVEKPMCSIRWISESPPGIVVFYLISKIISILSKEWFPSSRKKVKRYFFLAAKSLKSSGDELEMCLSSLKIQENRMNMHQ